MTIATLRRIAANDELSFDVQLIQFLTKKVQRYIHGTVLMAFLELISQANVEPLTTVSDGLRRAAVR